MINRLKRRFIVLAMTALVVLLTVIVAGMNLINYNTVVSEADAKLAVLSEYGDRLPFGDAAFGSGGMRDSGGPGAGRFEPREPGAGSEEDGSETSSDANDMSDIGRGKPFASRDNLEETRFFYVDVDSDNNIVKTNIDRISAVDESSAGTYAKKALKRGNEYGFVDEYRYNVSEENGNTRIIFLNCSTSLAAFRDFLYASMIMSLAGLVAVFFIICYFAGRIVRPVAESYEKQKRFITDAGHEIKTPLAIIKANIDVMKMDIEDVETAVDTSYETDAAGLSEVDGAADPDGHADLSGIRSSTDSLTESLTDIDGQVDRLTSLTNDLVYLSRMEESGDSLTMTEIPVSDIVSETVDSFSALAVERKKNIETDITPMLSIQGSSKEIEKLVSILTENALKYSPDGDTVRVGLHRDGKNVVLEIRNKALDPLSDEDLSHVFERFYRADRSRNSAAGGHGIGLSMASAIVSAHGGRIRARSGDGTEFIVTASMPAS